MKFEIVVILYLASAFNAEFLFQYGVQHNDMVVGNGDDENIEIELSQAIPLSNVYETKSFFISFNGAIFTRTADIFYPDSTNIPDYTFFTYYTDMKIEPSKCIEECGLYIRFGNQLSPSDLDIIRQIIGNRDPSFIPQKERTIFVTWLNMQPFHETTTQDTNIFQSIITSNGVATYVINNYHFISFYGEGTPQRRLPRVGYFASGQDLCLLPASNTPNVIGTSCHSNINKRGVYLFSVYNGIMQCEVVSGMQYKSIPNFALKNTDLCPAVYLPICGSDGSTYNNPCSFQSTFCSGYYNLRVLKSGECDNRVSTDSPTVSTDRPTLPTDRPTLLTDRPTGSTDRPTGSTDRPTGSTDRPTGSTDRPTGSTDRPTLPTDRPTGSTDRPTLPTDRPTGSTDRPTGSTDRPTGSTDRPTGSTDRPTLPTDRPTGSTDRPTLPTDRPTGSTDRPTSSTDRPTGSTERPYFYKLFPFGFENGDQELVGDDVTRRFQLYKPMPLFTNIRDYVHISTNGLLSFDEHPELSASELMFPSDRHFLSAYGADLVTGQGGAVYYRQTTDIFVLEKASALVNHMNNINSIRPTNTPYSTDGPYTTDGPYKTDGPYITYGLVTDPPTSTDAGPMQTPYKTTYDPRVTEQPYTTEWPVHDIFKAESALIVTYYNAADFNAPDFKNTFQVVLVSNGKETFAILNYERLDTMHAVTGYSDGFCGYHKLPISQNSRYLLFSSNVDEPGRHVFKLSNDDCILEKENVTGIRYFYLVTYLSPPGGHIVRYDRLLQNHEFGLPGSIHVDLAGGYATRYSFYSSSFTEDEKQRKFPNLEISYLYFGRQTVYPRGIHGFVVFKGTPQTSSFQYGQITIHYTGHGCMRQNFTMPMSSAPTVHLTADAGIPVLQLFDMTNIYAKDVTQDGFTACYRESVAFSGFKMIRIHYAAFSALEHEASELHKLRFSIGENRLCKYVKLNKAYNLPPLSYVTPVEVTPTQGSGALVAWVSRMGTNWAEVCARHEYDGIRINDLMNDKELMSLMRTIDMQELQNYRENLTEALAEKGEMDEEMREMLVTFVRQRVMAQHRPVVGDDIIYKFVEMMLRRDNEMQVDLIIYGDESACTYYSCPSHLECHVDDVTHQPSCGCIRDCPNVKGDDMFCADNHMTYKSQCHLDMLHCQQFGTEKRSEIKKIYEGKCESLAFESGQVKLERIPFTPDVFCKDVLLKDRNFHDKMDVHVQLSVVWNDPKYSEENHDASASWVENVSAGGFKACVLVAGRHFGTILHYPSVHYFAYQESFFLFETKIAAGVLELPTWETGSMCHPFEIPREKRNWRVLVSVEHNTTNAYENAMTAWVEPRLHRICARELQNFDGPHEGIKLHWFAMENEYLPIISESFEVDFPKMEVFPEARIQTTCQHVPFNFGFPSLANPTVIVSGVTYAHHMSNLLLGRLEKMLENGEIDLAKRMLEIKKQVEQMMNNGDEAMEDLLASMDKEMKQYMEEMSQFSINDIAVWIENVNRTSIKVCQKSIRAGQYREQVIIHAVVLPQLCSGDETFMAGSCYKDLTGDYTQNSASQICSNEASALSSADRPSKLYYLGSGSKGKWTSLTDSQTEGVWQWNTTTEINYIKWLPNEPDGGASSNCAIADRENDNYGLRDVPCGSLYSATCEKSAALQERSCYGFCMNGGNCSLTLMHSEPDFSVSTPIYSMPTPTSNPYQTKDSTGSSTTGGQKTYGTDFSSPTPPTYTTDQPTISSNVSRENKPRNLAPMLRCQCPPGFAGRKCEINLLELPECSKYRVFNESYLNYFYPATKDFIKLSSSQQCLREILPEGGWHRLTGMAGDVIASLCPAGNNKCGFKKPGYIQGEHPTIHDGVIKRKILYYDQFCDNPSVYSNVYIRNCGDFFTYKFEGLPYSCDYGLCGIDLKSQIEIMNMLRQFRERSQQ